MDRMFIEVRDNVNEDAARLSQGANPPVVRGADMIRIGERCARLMYWDQRDRTISERQAGIHGIDMLRVGKVVSASYAQYYFSEIEDMCLKPNGSVQSSYGGVEESSGTEVLLRQNGYFADGYKVYEEVILPRLKRGVGSALPIMYDNVRRKQNVLNAYEMLEKIKSSYEGTGDIEGHGVLNFFGPNNGERQERDNRAQIVDSTRTWARMNSRPGGAKYIDGHDLTPGDFTTAGFGEAIDGVKARPIICMTGKYSADASNYKEEGGPDPQTEMIQNKVRKVVAMLPAMKISGAGRKSMTGIQVLRDMEFGDFNLSNHSERYDTGSESLQIGIELYGLVILPPLSPL